MDRGAAVWLGAVAAQALSEAGKPRALDFEPLPCVGVDHGQAKGQPAEDVIANHKGPLTGTADVR